MADHRYAVSCRWAGSTALGYEAYDRGHDVVAAPAEAALSLSSDPHFRGDPRRLNPEQLLVAAAASCQLLSFLAVSARARLDVVRYEDDAVGVMPEAARRMWIERIELRPTIEVRGSHDDAAIERLVRVAHDECFIANSLRTQITVTPTIVR